VTNNVVQGTPYSSRFNVVLKPNGQPGDGRRGTPKSPLLGGGILGAGVGLFYSANWALGTQLIPPGKAGAMLGLSNLAGAGAGAVGAYLGGPIADGWDTRC
jgi:MFS family permease